MADEQKIPVIMLDDKRACKLVIDRASRENRSRRNALVTTILEALGGKGTISDGRNQGDSRRSFRDDIVEKADR